MTVPFFKLHVAGDDFVLVDASKIGGFQAVDGSLAQAILDRRRGVGGRGAIFVAQGETAGTVATRFFLGDGTESYSSFDAWFCAARWAFDSGRASGGKVRISTARGDRTLTALDSRSFAMEMDPPLSHAEIGRILRPEDRDDARLDLIVDGKSTSAYLISLDRPYAAIVCSDTGPGPKRIRTALVGLAGEAVPVVVRPAGRELVRFSAAEGVDRIAAAAVAVAAATLARKAEGEAVAEWRGRGAAVRFADFGSGKKAPDAGVRRVDDGPAVLIDRGRFWIEWKSPHRLLVAGLAEYAFEGRFDYLE